MPEVQTGRPNYEDRKKCFEKVQSLRPGRTLVCLFNFDRPAQNGIPGLSTTFQSDMKEALFRVLKESVAPGGAIDLCLYTRGGDTNAVWPIVSLLSEFDRDFEVLVPFRCHSSGTLLALGAKQMHLTAMAELSPIDPSTGNQFNPLDPAPTAPGSRLAISVEDVDAFRSFVLGQFKIPHEGEGALDEGARTRLQPFLSKLADLVHPLALGNVHRVHLQIKQLARVLLDRHQVANRDIDQAIQQLTSRFYSHIHMINRREAAQILGTDQVKFASGDLDAALDELLRSYEDGFDLRRPYLLDAKIGTERSLDARFIGGAVESINRSYLYETCATITPRSRLPPNVQVQLPPGQPMPLIAGLPREYDVTLKGQAWVNNKTPKGVTL